MGLDMYLYAREKPEDLAYWRKHNALHAWMEDLARRRGFEGTFNCTPLMLYEEDLDKLELAIREGKLVPQEGFFFGTTDYDPKEVMDEDLLAITKARQALKEGKEVFYDSWW